MRPPTDQRRLLEGGGEAPADPLMRRLLGAAARPVSVPRGLRERVLATPLAGRSGAHRAGRTAFALGLLAAGAAALLLPPRLGQRAPALEVVSVAGAGQVLRGDGRTVALDPGARLLDGETVRSSAGEPLAVAFPDLRVRLGAATSATFHRQRSGALDIGLSQGDLALVVQPRPSDRPLAVLARGYRVEVVGTSFTVRAPASGGAVEVAVAEGVVRVRGPGVDRVLRRGEAWSSAPPAAASAAPPASTKSAGTPAGAAAAPAARADMSLRRSVATADTAGSLTPARWKAGARPAARRLAARAQPSLPTEATRAIRPADPALTAAEATAPSRSPTPPGPPPPTPASSPTPLAPAVAPTAAPPTAAAPVPAPAAAPVPAASEEDRYEAAQALVAAGRYAQAAEALAQLARAGGSRSELALYQRGSLLLRHLADPGQAASVFADYRRRFPGGSLRPDVDLSSIDALLASGQLAEAGRQIEVFLAAYPDSERRAEVRLLRGHVARERGDCRRAGEDYDQLTSGRSPVAGEALYFAAFCRRELGDAPGARRRLQEYLARFPQGRFAGAAREALGVRR